jgi:hypothetical protein
MKRAPRAQIFDAAGARVTEPGVFDRDAADAAWIKAVEAAGVAKAERTDKTAAKTVETHGAPATPTQADKACHSAAARRRDGNSPDRSRGRAGDDTEFPRRRQAGREGCRNLP